MIIQKIILLTLSILLILSYWRLALQFGWVLGTGHPLMRFAVGISAIRQRRAALTASYGLVSVCLCAGTHRQAANRIS